MTGKMRAGRRAIGAVIASARSHPFAAEVSVAPSIPIADAGIDAVVRMATMSIANACSFAQHRADHLNH